MSDLVNKLTPTKASTDAPAPQFFRVGKSAEAAELEALIDQQQPQIIDTYESQLKEYFVLQNPALHLNPPERDKQFQAFKEEHYGAAEPQAAGIWVYLPWRNLLLHLLEDAWYQEVRTGRNRNLIPAAEQRKYYDITIALGGLSVGNSAALAIVLTGGGKRWRLADPDTLELTNLNRIRASITELTEPKVYMTARQIYELDPYASLTLYPEGVTKENIEEFCAGADIIIDEVDNLPIKLMLRDQAKQHKTPLLMATDNGDSGLLDIERHDLKDIPYFHGRITEQDIADMLSGKLALPQIGKMIGEKLVGFNITEPRMQASLLEIGRTIPTWPQLGGAAVLNGVAIAAAVRKIVTEQPVIEKRAVLSLSSWLIPGYDAPDQVEQRQRNTQQFEEAYNAIIEEFLKNFSPKS